MNRIQFFVLTGLSSLVALLLLGHVLLEYQVSRDQIVLAEAQQMITQGQTFEGYLKQMAVRIYNDSVKTQDQGLKDLLVRQKISYNPPAASSSSSQAPAAAPAAH